LAIVGPAQLPAILKLNLQETKFEVLSTLGHPNVLVEISEPQLEQAIRSSVDFVAQYFPAESLLAYFYTQPLQSTYDLPADAYSVQQVNWDPATTRIGDIFGAESFLFCFPKNTKILDKDDSLQDIREWKTTWKAKTPFGPRKLNIFARKSKSIQLARQLIYEDGKIVTTINHPIFCVNKNEWLNNDQINIGDFLLGERSSNKIIGVVNGGMIESFAVDVPHAQCLFACLEGKSILVH